MKAKDVETLRGRTLGWFGTGERVYRTPDERFALIAVRGSTLALIDIKKIDEAPNIFTNVIDAQEHIDKLTLKEIG